MDKVWYEATHRNANSRLPYLLQTATLNSPVHLHIFSHNLHSWHPFCSATKQVRGAGREYYQRGRGGAWVTSGPQHMVLLSVATVYKGNPYTGGRGSKNFQKMGTRWWQGTQRLPGTHICWRTSRPQGHSAPKGIYLIKHPNDRIWNRTHDLPAWSSAWNKCATAYPFYNTYSVTFPSNQSSATVTECCLGMQAFCTIKLSRSGDQTQKNKTPLLRVAVGPNVM